MFALICFYTKNLVCITGFTKSCEISNSDYQLRFVCPSVRPHGTTWLPVDGFSLDFMFEDFIKNNLRNWANLTVIVGTLHEDLCTIVTMSRLICLRMWDVTDRICREYRNKHLVILVDNQLDAHFFYNTFIYLNPLHVSNNYVLILRRTIVWTQLLV